MLGDTAVAVHSEDPRWNWAIGKHVRLPLTGRLIPIIADEDAVSARDLPRLQGCADGINIKLVKCGGIGAALGMIGTARALGLRVMLGCMVESAILATAAAHLSPLVDWADLDGPFLTRDDPFAGITYERGKIVLPDGPGLGVCERAGSAA